MRLAFIYAYSGQGDTMVMHATYYTTHTVLTEEVVVTTEDFLAEKLRSKDYTFRGIVNVIKLSSDPPGSGGINLDMSAL